MKFKRILGAKMKQYTYPAVFYYDEEYNQFAVEFSDICIYAEGDTMEDAYKNAQGYLIAYLECCDELGVEPNKPNTYNFVEKMHPNGKTLLVTVEYEHKQSTEPKKQDTFTNLNDDIVEDIDDDIAQNIMDELKEKTPAINKFVQERMAQVETKPADDGDDGDDDFSLPEIE